MLHGGIAVGVRDSCLSSGNRVMITQNLTHKELLYMYPIRNGSFRIKVGMKSFSAVRRNLVKDAVQSRLTVWNERGNTKVGMC